MKKRTFLLFGLLAMLVLSGCDAIVVEEREPVWIGCAAVARMFT